MRIKLFMICVTFIFAAAVYTANRSEGKVDVAGNGERGIVVTLSEPDRSALLEGDTLRKARKFNEAIAAYQGIIKNTEVERAVRDEARYNIGLCKLENGDYADATARFNDMFTDFAGDGNALAHVQYCHAWIEVQEGKYDEAIARLDQSLGSEGFTDRELRARTLFMVGRIYANFLQDYERAKPVFERVRNEYPDTKAAEHPYLKIN